MYSKFSQIVVVLAFAASLVTTVYGQEGPTRFRTGRCVLQVKQKTYLDGPCEIGITDDQGSFTIGVGETHRARYFAYVNMEDDGAHGYWNEEPDSNHAHTSLGILQRHGACWENETARVCAYK